MDIMVKIAIGGLAITILGNIIAIVAFLTRQKDNIDFLQKTFIDSKSNVINSVQQYRENSEKIIEDLKNDSKEHKQFVANMFTEFKNTIKEDINRLEKKQEKHNNLIERMVRVEDSTKSAHKRLDDYLGNRYECN